MEGKKRVGCFYRVSTMGQLDGGDISMQRNACRNFVDKQGWTIVKEYTEKGVSGYKVSVKKRDEIQRAKSDAENGLFDILLCFMFDRLGRKQDETPLVVKWFSTKGIEIWSVKEGQQKFEDHNDDLINFIRYWQSSSESKKTSMRVTENHEQMVKAGLFRGGVAPYGYKLVLSGIINKKGKEVNKLAIDEKESVIAKEIFRLVYEKGFGAGRIVKYLNNQAKIEDGYKSRSGGNWNTGVINFMLRNPIYKGYMTFGKRRYISDKYSTQSNEEWILSETQNKELIIIEESMWDKIQEIRNSRSPKNVKVEGVKSLTVSKSPLLLVGSIKCGHCGTPLTTTYNTKTYINKAGEVKKYRQPKYRCSGKALGKTDCDGQTIYSQNKIELFILEKIDKYVNELKKVDFTKKIANFEKENLSRNEKEIKIIHKKLEETYSDLSTLKGEVTKSLLGKSSFKPDLLNSLLEEKEVEVRKLNDKIRTIENEIKDKKNEVNDMKSLQAKIPVWKTEFHNANYEQKKIMLSYIIDSIIVFKDRIDLNVKFSINQSILPINNE